MTEVAVRQLLSIARTAALQMSIQDLGFSFRVTSWLSYDRIRTDRATVYVGLRIADWPRCGRAWGDSRCARLARTVVTSGMPSLTSFGGCPARDWPSGRAIINRSLFLRRAFPASTSSMRTSGCCRSWAGCSGKVSLPTGPGRAGLRWAGTGRPGRHWGCGHTIDAIARQSAGCARHSQNTHTDMMRRDSSDSRLNHANSWSTAKRQC